MLHVAIAGSGPSGFYAAEALLRAGADIAVDMYERLPVPYGLVRSGVAPDHPKLKEAMLVYERIARSGGFSFFGNVEIGRDLGVDELRDAYHAVIFACGAPVDRRLGIPGEDLPGSYTATEFVGWYNGHPDYAERAFDLGCDAVAIIGQGNVAADVCRMLAKPVDELRGTDIAEYALEALARSRVRHIHVVGRRGPAQAKFTPRELRELGEIPGVAVHVDPAICALGPACARELAERTNVNAAKNVALFESFARAAAAPARRTIHFHFLLSPREILGEGRTEGILFDRNRLEGPAFEQVAGATGATMTLPCGAVFRSIGYRGLPLAGLPYDPRRGVLPNRGGRLLDGEAVLPGLYVTGWLKRGPTGIIGSNRADSLETVESLLADLPALATGARGGGPAVAERLRARGVRAVSFDDWLLLDAIEVARGQPRGKPREKITRIPAMLQALEQAGAEPGGAHESSLSPCERGIG